MITYLLYSILNRYILLIQHLKIISRIFSYPQPPIATTWFTLYFILFIYLTDISQCFILSLFEQSFIAGNMVLYKMYVLVVLVSLCLLLFKVTE